MTSTIKVNKIEKVDGSTIELGGPGTSVNLACGATQTGFGRTGTVDWCTTAKTSPFTSENGKGYFINTTSSGVTVTLPSSPSAGDIVAINDYARTFACNAVTLCRNGSKLCGVCVNATLDTKGQSITLVYVDGTKGWKPVNDDATSSIGSAFVTATGGTITTCGNFKIHTFTGDGCFQVTDAGNSAGSNKVSYMVVAGGAGGGYSAGNSSGGGGAGGFREGKAPAFDTYTASPLVAPDGLSVSVQTYPITVGGGGAAGTPGAPVKGSSGANSVFSSITSAGGGGGGGVTGSAPCAPGVAGGSGGGATGYVSPGSLPISGGAGNTPPVSPPQGTAGGTANGRYASTGGGGATAAGGNTSPGDNVASSAGGAGATTSINGSPTSFAGGGGGAGYGPPSPAAKGAGGLGGGGDGGGNCRGTMTGVAGTTNTGGGGGGGGYSSPISPVSGTGAAGGSGIVIIRYKFQ
tara:strand:+ start:153 stop:1541 length:1389 start_codon:yes stop_codon:yes gene_type:complete